MMLKVVVRDPDEVAIESSNLRPEAITPKQVTGKKGESFAVVHGFARHERDDTEASSVFVVARVIRVIPAAVLLFVDREGVLPRDPLRFLRDKFGGLRVPPRARGLGEGQAVDETHESLRRASDADFESSLAQAPRVPEHLECLSSAGSPNRQSFSRHAIGFESLAVLPGQVFGEQSLGHHACFFEATLLQEEIRELDVCPSTTGRDGITPGTGPQRSLPTESRCAEQELGRGLHQLEIATNAFDGQRPNPAQHQLAHAGETVATDSRDDGSLGARSAMDRHHLQRAAVKNPLPDADRAVPIAMPKGLPRFREVLADAAARRYG